MRLVILLCVLVASIIWLLVPPPLEFVMEGEWTVREPPSGDRCPVVDPTARKWVFNLPAESTNGQFVVQDSLRDRQCKTGDCPVVHTLTVEVVEWKARAGFFSGYSEFIFDAELVRVGEGCRDRAVMRGHMSVDQGSRGDVSMAANAMGRWALEYFSAKYDELYGPPG